MLSRLWYLVLAVTAGGALAGGFLNKSAAGREAAFQLEEQLRRDRVETELWLRLDARLRLDALASLVVEPEVRQTLRSASGRPGTVSTGTRRRLSVKLNSLNSKLDEGKGDLVFAVDTEGEVVATLDKDAKGPERLDKMPLVQDALRGFMRDDVWVYNDEVYRMAARPIFDGGRYVGAIVHGIKVGDDLAERLGAKLPDASVVFFLRDHLIAAHAGSSAAPTSSELKAILPTAIARMTAADGSIEIADGVRAVVSPIRGAAAHAKVGYMIGRRGSGVGLGGLFANTYQEDVASLPWPLVIGVPVALLLLGLALLHLEHDRGMGILRKSAEKLAKGELARLPAEKLRRRQRKLAEDVNSALVAGVGYREDRGSRAAVDLDHILDSTRGSVDTGYFGYPDAEAPTAKRPSLEDAEVARDKSGDAGPGMSPTSTSASRPKRASSWPSRGPSSRHRSPDTAAPSRDEQAPFELDDPPTRPNALREDYDPFDEGPEESTQVKHVPQALIEASAPSEESEQAHFRQVFEQFVTTQKECGVPVEGLTFDKFVRKLHAAREQVMKRNNASAVRFTVYVKEGRAALRASPVNP